MAKLFYALLTLVNIAIFGECAYFVITRGLVTGAGWTPVELVTIVLAALAVLLTVLGIYRSFGYLGVHSVGRRCAGRCYPCSTRACW
jgi:hypothetical protein